MVAPASAVWGYPDPAGWGMRWKDARFNGEWLGKEGDSAYTIPSLPRLPRGIPSFFP